MKYSLRSLFLAFFMSVAALAFAQTSIHLGYCSDEIPSNHQSAVLSDAISALPVLIRPKNIQNVNEVPYKYTKMAEKSIFCGNNAIFIWSG